MMDRLSPWDHLAGTLIAAEAGAQVACLDGSPYDASRRSGGVLAASDRDMWDLLVREVFSNDQTTACHEVDRASRSASPEHRGHGGRCGNQGGGVRRISAADGKQCHQAARDHVLTTLQ